MISALSLNVQCKRRTVFTMTQVTRKERTDLQFLDGLFDLLNFDFAEAFDLKQRLSSCRVHRLSMSALI